MGLGQYAPEGVSVPGVNGTQGKKRTQRLTRMVNQVFELREQGMSIKDIKAKLHTNENAVYRILHDPDNVRRRLTQYNERLRSACPKALRVVHETLDSTAPAMAGERARMAQWVLEMTKTVGKDAPVNIFLNSQHTQVNVNQDMLEAARAVAAKFRAATPTPELPQATVIEAEVISVTPKEETSDGNSTTSVDVTSTGGNDTTTLPTQDPS